MTEDSPTTNDFDRDEEAAPAISRRHTGDPSRRGSAAKSSLTPAMRQYLEQKERVGEAILLFRMGDFYETFYEDAKTVSRVLGLTLTSRNKNSDDPIPLAGVPFHAVDTYVARLVRAGYKVAISEQQEDPRQAKGVVKRGVERIITPGTLTDENLLDEKSDNCLAAICPVGRTWEAGEIGLACVELASGRFFAQMLSGSELADELARLRPAELLIPEAEIDAADAYVERLRESLEATVSSRPRHAFDEHMANRRICEHFGVAGVGGFGFDQFDASLCAAAAILDYLRETQKSALGHILKIVPRHSGDRVVIDQAALRSLEVERTMRDGAREGSLLGAVDMTAGPMGARRLREWLCFPLVDAGEIRIRQAAVTALREQPDRLARIRETIRRMNDMERIAARLGVGRASPRDLVGLGRTLRACAELAETIGQAATGDAIEPRDLLGGIAAALFGHSELAEFLEGALAEDAPPTTRDGGFIANGYHAELDRLRSIRREGHQWLAEFQAREAQRTGIPTLKVGYNSVFGYYIEITHQHRDKAPPDYVRKQTVRNAERYITDELKHHETEVLGAEDRAKQLEVELFEEIRRRAAAEMPRLLAAADGLATLDVLAALAELSRRRDYCRPELAAAGDDAEGAASCGVLEIVDGRHPVLEVSLAERFVPNDCRMSPEGDRLLIITGPNMAGKSTYIRQVALLALLAQTGSYVPAKAMRWTPVDRIFARVGASDELARGQSTFMVEMVETARILNNATVRSLVVLDEIGRGTSTYDGLALAWAISEYVSERIGCRTLFATHYHELTELAGQLSGVANYNVAVKEELRPQGKGRDVVFLHKIIPGATDRSYGVHVAAMAGLPGSVVRRGEEVLSELERTFERRSRGSGLRTKRGQDAEQLSLFAEERPMPQWWRQLVDALNAVDVNKTAPIDALAILQRLQAVLREKS
jgi:DNA mismatch repair protein MutS